MQRSTGTGGGASSKDAAIDRHAQRTPALINTAQPIHSWILMH